MRFSKFLKYGGISLLGGLTYATMFSCSDDLKEDISSAEDNELKTDRFPLKALFSDKHTISQSEAENIALNFINTQNSNEELRNSSVKQISKTVVLTRQNANGLRSSAQNPDTLAYIVNMANNGGFVYVCADNREIEPVMAAFDNGSYNADSIAKKTALLSMMKDLENSIQKDIEEFESKKDQRRSLVEKAIKEGKIDTCQSVNQLRTKTTISNTTPTYLIGPLLKSHWTEKLLQQIDDNVNINHDIWSVSKYLPKDNTLNSRHVAPGCVTIAIGQLMNYWYYPMNLGKPTDESHYNGSTAIFSDPTKGTTVTYNPGDFLWTPCGWDWATAPNEAYRLKAINARAMLYKYIYEYAENAGAITGTSYAGTGMYIEKVLPFLEENGYYVQKMSSDWQWYIIDWILKTWKAPVIVASNPINDNSGLSGHAYLVDGILTTKTDQMTVEVVNGKVTKIYGSNQIYTDFAHINWGWGGLYDGWFKQGTLDAKEGKLYDKPEYANNYIITHPNVTNYTNVSGIWFAIPQKEL